MTLEGDQDQPLTAETVDTKVQEPNESEDAAAQEPAPAAAPAAPQPKAKAEEPAGEEPTVDFSKIDDETLLKLINEREGAKSKFLSSDEVRRVVQSEKEKELARERRRVQDEARQRARAEGAREAEEERRRLAELEDLEGLGQLELDRIRDANTLLKAADQITATLEEIVRQDPDLKVLGEDRMAEIYDSVQRRKGSIHDLEKELWRARAKLDVDEALAESSKTIEERVREEVEAALTSAGVKIRTEEVEKGRGASAAVSGGAAPRASQEEMTYEKASTAYGDGEMSWEEFKPYKDAHEKQRRR